MFLFVGCSGPGNVEPIDKKRSSGFDDAFYRNEMERSKRMPYANDFGSSTIDVTGYPPEMQKIYTELVAPKCGRCHTMARVVDSEFVQPTGDAAIRKEKITEWQQQHPEMFFERNVWRVGDAMWERYVRRMMAKPGSDISVAEVKEITEFLAYDSEQRKTGKNAQTWATYRRKLLAAFKQSNPKQSKALYGD